MRWMVGLGALAISAILPGRALAWPGCELDDFAVVVEGDALTVLHEDITYNCCLDSVTYTVEQTADRIELHEAETAENFCACLCCFDASVRVENLAPGDYVLSLIWYDHDTGSWEEWTRPVTIVGNPGAVPFVASRSNTGCLDPTAVPGFDAETWGIVKSRYRDSSQE